MKLRSDGLPSARLLRAIVRPEIAIRSLIRRFSLGSVEFRLAFGALARPEYAFGVRQAIFLAKKLGLTSVSVIEFGVARGAGLIELEKYAAELGRAWSVQVEVYGFDLGSGLPAPSDYRDLGYVWKKGAYRMDAESLRSRLKNARLVMGDVGETVPRFNAAPHAPVGFISFDLDYYTSTVDAFRIFQSPDAGFLPRVFCYFDDIVSDGLQIHCDDVGQLLAIREFNEKSDGTCRLSAPSILRTGSLFPAVWQEQLRVYHRFNHPDYNTYIGE
jgi:hypothetical protein